MTLYIKTKALILLSAILFQNFQVYGMSATGNAMVFRADQDWSERYQSPSTAPRFKTQLITRDFSDIPEEQIPGWDEKGIYIAPNELRPFLMRDIYESFKGQQCNKPTTAKKALISVGSFRALFATLASEYPYSILLDVDPTTVQFNRANLRLISDLKKTSLSKKQQRLLYLSVILNRPAWIIEEEDSIEWNEIRKKLADYGDNSHDPRLLIDSLPDAIQGSAKAILDLNISEDSPYGKSDFRRTMLGYFRALHSYSKNLQVLYWANDFAWKKLQLMIEEDRIVVLNGNIAGEQTLMELGKVLKEKSIFVSAFDFSNAFSIVLGNGLGDRLLKNLRSLPLTSDFKLIFNTAVIQPEVLPEEVYEDWLYCVYSLPPKRLLEPGSESIFERSYWGHRQLDLNQKFLEQHWSKDWNTYQSAINFGEGILINSCAEPNDAMEQLNNE